MRKKQTKGRIKSKYVQLRKDLKSSLPTARGWKKSKEYKRILRNEKQATYRLKKKREAAIIERDDFEIKNIVANEELLHMALNPRGAQNDTIIDLYDSEKNRGGQVVASISDFDGNLSTYSSTYAFDKAIQELYRIGAKIQEDTGKYPIVSATVSKEKGITYYIVEASLSGIDTAKSIVKKAKSALKRQFFELNSGTKYIYSISGETNNKSNQTESPETDLYEKILKPMLAAKIAQSVIDAAAANYLGY